MDWYFVVAGTKQQQGPVRTRQLRAMMEQGQLGPADLVWRSGMIEWQPAGQVRELAASQNTNESFAVAEPALDPIPTAQASPVPTGDNLGYFTPGLGMPARAVTTLRGFAKSTGPVDEWPLNDDQLHVLAEAALMRRRIDAGAGLARLLGALAAIATAIFGVVMIVSFATSGPQTRGFNGPTFGGILLLYGGIATLYFVCAGAMKKHKSWGALVLTILSGIALAMTLFSVLMVAATSRDPAATSGAMIGGIIGGLIGFAFFWCWFQAYRSTGKLLGMPVWAQEAVVLQATRRKTLPRAQGFPVGTRSVV
jgi:hypothetical protein